MKKEIKSSLEKIEISKELENQIMEKTVLKENKAKRLKLSYLLGIFIIVFAVFVISVNADNIELFIKEIISRGSVITTDGQEHRMYTEVNGIKLKNLDKYEKDKYIKSTIEEVEETFGITLLKYDSATSDEVFFELLTDREINSERKGMVDRLYIRQSAFYKDGYGFSELMGGNYGFSLFIRIISDNALEHTIMTYLDEMNVITGKQTIEEYYSKNLDTNVLIFQYEVDASDIQMGAMFVYKNIRYEFSGYFEKEIPINDLKNIIEEMHE